MNRSTSLSPEHRHMLTAVKAKQQVSWACGDYGRIGNTVQITGEALCEAMDLRAGSSVLDVAGGNGNASLAAARRFGHVVCTDYVPELLHSAARRAETEGFNIRFQQADAENLPFDNHSFDNVVSTFGVMFTPNQARAASELVRVCKPGGKIGLANWTADGFIGELFKVVGHYAAQPVKLDPPTRWADDAFVRAHLATEDDALSIETRWFVFRYKSPEHWLDVFKTYYGPLVKAFEATEPHRQPAFDNDILALIASFNRATDGSMVVPSSYAEVVITKRAKTVEGGCHA